MIRRRGFVQLFGTAAVVALTGSTEESVSEHDDFPGMYGLLVGPDGERPVPNGSYFDQWNKYRFVYVATDTGARFQIDDESESWTQFDTDLVTYATADRPVDPGEGHLSFNDIRKTPQWFDGDNYEWPTFVDNQDVTSGTITVSNTTSETEVFRAAPDVTAIDVQGRVMVIFLSGVYDTASSNDSFTYRVYVGPVGFDPTVGEGSVVSIVTTVQENVTNGPWRARTTLVVNSTGATGALANHTTSAFNDTTKDDDDPEITVDTTTGEEFVATVEWNNAKAGNSVTRGIGYLQQNA